MAPSFKIVRQIIRYTPKIFPSYICISQYFLQNTLGFEKRDSVQGHGGLEEMISS